MSIDLYETDFPGIYVTEDGYLVDEYGSIYDGDGDLIEEDALVLNELDTSSIASMASNYMANGQYDKANRALAAGARNDVVNTKVRHFRKQQADFARRVADRDAELALQFSGARSSSPAPAAATSSTPVKTATPASSSPAPSSTPAATATKKRKTHKPSARSIEKQRRKALVKGTQVPSSPRGSFSNIGGAPATSRFKLGKKGKIGLGLAAGAGLAYGAHRAYKHYKNESAIDLYETDEPGIYVTEDGYFVDEYGSIYDGDGDLIEEEALDLYY